MGPAVHVLGGVFEHTLPHVVILHEVHGHGLVAPPTDRYDKWIASLKRQSLLRLLFRPKTHCFVV